MNMIISEEKHMGHLFIMLFFPFNFLWPNSQMINDIFPNNTCKAQHYCLSTHDTLDFLILQRKTCIFQHVCANKLSIVYELLNQKTPILLIKIYVLLLSETVMFSKTYINPYPYPYNKHTLSHCVSHYKHNNPFSCHNLSGVYSINIVEMEFIYVIFCVYGILHSTVFQSGLRLGRWPKCTQMYKANVGSV